jgi:hypothetical protein
MRFDAFSSSPSTRPDLFLLSDLCDFVTSDLEGLDADSAGLSVCRSFFQLLDRLLSSIGAILFSPINDGLLLLAVHAPLLCFVRNRLQHDLTQGGDKSLDGPSAALALPAAALEATATLALALRPRHRDKAPSTFHDNSTPPRDSKIAILYEECRVSHGSA